MIPFATNAAATAVTMPAKVANAFEWPGRPPKTVPSLGISSPSQRRTEPRPQATCTEKFVKIPRPEICSRTDRQTDRQTERQTDTDTHRRAHHNTSPPLCGRINNKNSQYLQYSQSKLCSGFWQNVYSTCLRYRSPQTSDDVTQYVVAVDAGSRAVPTAAQAQCRAPMSDGRAANIARRQQTR